jgi:DNA primase
MEIIDQVRKRVDIIDIARKYTKLKKRGRKYVGLCPFHKEDQPSFTVDSEKQLFHCFGCGVGGDVFTLFMEKENVDFTEALKHLARRYHIKMPPEFISEEIEKKARTYRIPANLAQSLWFFSEGDLVSRLDSALFRWKKDDLSDKALIFELEGLLKELTKTKQSILSDTLKYTLRHEGHGPADTEWTEPPVKSDDYDGPF